VTNDEIPETVARVVGHVCGVIAVGMAALSVLLVAGLVHKPSTAGVVLGSISIGLTALMLRWAGALTGYWNTRGRLAVPKRLYSFLGALFVGLSAMSAYLLAIGAPDSFDDALVLLVGAMSGAAVAYLCYLATQRFK
jgi:hypothetical protein